MFSTYKEYLREKWSSYIGTCFMARKGSLLLVLRNRTDRKQFAIVMLNTRGSFIDVVKEINTAKIEIAQIGFRLVVKKLEFEMQ